MKYKIPQSCVHIKLFYQTQRRLPEISYAMVSPKSALGRILGNVGLHGKRPYWEIFGSPLLSSHYHLLCDNY